MNLLARDALRSRPPRTRTTKFGAAFAGVATHLLVEKRSPKIRARNRAGGIGRAESMILQVGHVERFNPVLSALEARLTHPRFIEAHRPRLIQTEAPTSRGA